MPREFFPILNANESEKQIRIPWAMMLEHEAQAIKNHCGQNVERLAERWGCTTGELLSILTDTSFDEYLKTYLKMPQEEREEKLRALVNEWIAAK